MAKRVEWQKNLTVDKRIVRLLSSKTYEDFPGALRELVSNAYDADATEVRIKVDVEGDKVEVYDNGNGMTPEDFDFFLRIAGQQRGKQTSPQFGRARIGQFGIGFLALFPFGARIKIKSTARASDLVFEATIPAESYIREGGRTIDVEEVPIVGFQVHDKKMVDVHETRITVSGLSGLVGRFFNRKATRKKEGLSVRTWAPEKQLIWALEEDLPIDWREGSLYAKAFADLGSSGLRVFLNGIELFRNSPGTAILESDTWRSGSVECRYVIATKWRSIAPVEDRFLKQRLRNVGVGARTSFGLGLEGKAYSRLAWLTGELRIQAGLENLLSIDRRGFVEGPEYDEFREFFRNRLAHYARFVEHVAEADRDIKRQLSESRMAEVGPRRDVVRTNVEALKSRGFKVVQKSRKEGGGKQAVSVDLHRRVVEIIDDHPQLEDKIPIGKESLAVRYSKWPIGDRSPAVRRGRDGVVEINESFGPFRSRRYGGVLRRALVMMLVISEKAGTPRALLEEFSRKLGDEFPDGN